MKTRTLICAAVIALATAGCATTQDAANSMRAGYTGQNMDAFVMRHGAPYQRHHLNNGDTLYVWRSGVDSYTMPATTTVQGTSTNGWFSGNAQTTGGGVVRVFCEVKILASPDGTIKDIAPQRDTIGNIRLLSRCGEIFKS